MGLGPGGEGGGDGGGGGVAPRAEVERLEKMIEKADPRVLAFDIECTKVGR